MPAREPTEIDRDELIEETRHVIEEIEEAVDEVIEKTADDGGDG